MTKLEQVLNEAVPLTAAERIRFQQAISSVVEDIDDMSNLLRGCSDWLSSESDNFRDQDDPVVARKLGLLADSLNQLATKLG